MPFHSVNIVFDNRNDEWDTGKRAWLSHKDSDWSIVIQDDAIICDNFYVNVSRAIEKVPTKSAISFYTGTCRPYPKRVSLAAAVCESANISWIRYNTLLWGVCVALPTEAIPGILESVKYVRLPYDNRIGQFFKMNSLPVYYAMPSLVDHNDELLSIAGHNIPSLRIAHNFIDSPYVTFNDSYVDL